MILPSGIVLTFKKTDDHEYDVLFNGQVIGSIYRDPDAWSYAAWFIAGGRRDYRMGGVNNKTRKLSGFTGREFAAAELALTQSAKIIELSAEKEDTNTSLQWRVNTPNMFNEIIANNETVIFTRPLQLTANLLGQVAQRCSELNDPKPAFCFSNPHILPTQQDFTQELKLTID
jgi:hypothetical protein